MDLSNVSKSNWYLDLTMDLKARGYDVHLFAIEVSARGLVGRSMYAFLRAIGLSNRQTKHFVKELFEAEDSASHWVWMKKDFKVKVKHRASVIKRGRSTTIGTSKGSQRRDTWTIVMPTSYRKRCSRVFSDVSQKEVPRSSRRFFLKYCGDFGRKIFCRGSLYQADTLLIVEGMLRDYVDMKEEQAHPSDHQISPAREHKDSGPKRSSKGPILRRLHQKFRRKYIYYI